MLQKNKILIGRGENPVYLLPSMANRHGLIAGATGTGKTITLKVLAEGLSDMGVPVFLADVKGDVSSIASAGASSSKVIERLEQVGIKEEDFKFQGYPVRFWDVLGKDGIPIRATVSDIGPVLLSRLLNLTEVQQGVLNIVFKVADDQGLNLYDFKDLRIMLQYVGEHRKELALTYGNVTTQSVGAIQRALLALEDNGAEQFLGEPMLDIKDWFAKKDGRGIINVLHCVELIKNPLLYATFMLWMLGELYETLPEVGDPAKPKLVFFFDEAHLLFTGAPKALVEKIVQVVKLVRSKGVGIFFISQSPADIPDAVLAQLNNRIQHALRAYTPAEMKAVRVAAQSFRANPAFKTEDAISSMGTGVALVSMLDKDGVPTVVEQATICPPQSSFDALDDVTRLMLTSRDDLYAKYKDAVDRESAYEILTGKEAEEQEAQAAAEAEKAAAKAAKEAEKAEKQAKKEQQAQYKAEGRDKDGRTKAEKAVYNAVKSTTKSAARTATRSAAQSIIRGLLGNKSKTVMGKAASQAATNFAGRLANDLVGNFFK